MPIQTARKKRIAGNNAASMITVYGVPVNPTITNAPAPINGGMIWPPEDATASTAPANDLGYPRRTIVGMVTAPMEAALAEAEPEMEPNMAEASTATLPAPPRRRPAAAMAILRKPWPASPAFSTAPMITKIATTLTDTPVNAPQTPPSVMVNVTSVLANGTAVWPNCPDTYWPKNAYNNDTSATIGNGQPIARRAISSVTTSSTTPIVACSPPLMKPY